MNDGREGRRGLVVNTGLGIVRLPVRIMVWPQPFPPLRKTQVPPATAVRTLKIPRQWKSAFFAKFCKLHQR